MSHCDQDTLSLLALGEATSTQNTSHLDECAECQHELATLKTVVDTARAELSGVLVHESDGRDATEGTPVTRIPPPPRVWEQIAAATGVTTAPRPEFVIAGGSHPLASRNGSGPAVPDTTSPATTEVTAVAVHSDPGAMAGGSAADAGPARPAPPGEPVVAPPAGSTPAGTTPPTVPADAGVTAPRPAPRARAGAGGVPRQRRDAGSLIGIGMVALLVGLLGGYGISTYVQDKPATTAAPTVIAGTTLSGLPLAPAAAGNASVVRTTTGRKLDVDVRRLDSVNGFYEVWLISPDISKMVSVGVLQGPKGEFTLPAGVDLSQFPLVDVSIQSYDGSGAHSGKSVLRGTLRA